MTERVIKGLIFDLDGTLVNSLEDLADSMNRVLISQGYPTHSYDAYRYFVGAGVRNLVKRALPEAEQSDAIIDKCLELMLADYDRSCFTKTSLFDGIAEAIETLISRGVKLAVFSNKMHDLTLKFVEVLIGAHKFEVILGTKPGIPIKPDPAGALLISGQMGIPPELMGYVGDSGTDMQAAQRAGMYAIGALWGFRTKDELLEGGAHAVISHPSELLKIMDIS